MFENRSSESKAGESRSAVCIKGRSRRIVVVNAKENPIYEQVIYIVRDDAAERGVTAQDVLQEAQTHLAPSGKQDWIDAAFEETQEYETERVSRILFALSGVALALSGGLLMYWFFTI